MRIIFWFCCVFGLLSCWASDAKIYVWTDEKGKKHYSQNPPKGKKFDEKTVKTKSRKKKHKPFDFEKERPEDNGVCTLAVNLYLGEWRQSILQKLRDRTAACEKMYEQKVLRGSLKECYYKQQRIKDEELEQMQKYRKERGC